MIEEDLVAYVTNLPGVAAIIGDRMTPLVVEQGADLPALSYQVIDTPRVRSHSGPSGLAHPRVQFNCVSKDYTEAKLLAQAIRFGVDGFRGSWNGRSVSAEARGENDDRDPTTGRFTRMLDVIIWHREEVI